VLHAVPEPGAEDVQVRPPNDEEWALLVEFVVDQADTGDEGFRRWQMGECARLIALHRGRWWAAWALSFIGPVPGS